MTEANERRSRALSSRESTLVEVTARHLVRVLRRRIDDVERPISQESAAAVAFMQVCRKERPGGTLGIEARERLRADVDALSHQFDPTRQQSVVAFAKAVAESAVRAVPARASVNARVVSNNQRALATSAVRAEMLGAESNEEIVRRAALRMFREKRRGHIGHRTLHLDDTDPLKDLLDLPSSHASLLRQDIRHVLAKGKVGDVLREAARFSDVTLRDVLGEELWALGRPVGFADGRQRQVLIEVESDAVAHALSMRKGEILSRLQSAPGLDAIRDVRFAVKTKESMNVAGTRRAGEPNATLDDVLARLRKRQQES